MNRQAEQKYISKLLIGVDVIKIIGSADVFVTSICNNSQDVRAGSMFVAVVGANADGHRYIQDAIRKGSTVVVCQTLPEDLNVSVTYVQVSNTSLALARIAGAFYDHPSKKLKLVAVTGTSGKTTTTYLLHHIFSSLGYRTGMLSTIENRIGDQAFASELTTPNVITVNRFLSEMVSCGVEFCLMEASSHAMEQHRVAGLEFAGAVFTNITHDHLDYHQTFANYINAKKKLFDSLPSTAFALVNAEDKHASVMLQNTSARRYTFGIRCNADFRLKVLSNTIEGLELKFDNENIWTKLIGEFNAYNILAAYGAAVLLGLEKAEILLALSTADPVPGRFEYTRVANGPVVVVDFAHKPDALSNVLLTVEKIKRKTSRVILLVGCGGNRDTTKRPIMAGIGCKHSDVLILTSDNPRFEDPQTIADQMMEGVPVEKRAGVLTILDRRAAIEKALELATIEDIVVIPGKGHETYQVVGDAKLPFSDKKICAEYMKSRQTQSQL